MLEPALPGYLSKPYSGKPDQKGGTLIAEVWDLEKHREQVKFPDGYRPKGCPRCNGFLQGHGCRFRQLVDQPTSAEEKIRRYWCDVCVAVWQVLPAFLARHLHRTWGAIQSRLVAAGELGRTGAEWRVRSIPSTLRRWSERLAASAIVLTQALTEAKGDESSAVAAVTQGSWCSRKELVEGLANSEAVEKRQKLAQLGCLIHRVVPGVRVM